MRFPLVAALALTALPLHADSLPQGDFMLGTFILPDTLAPLYMTVTINGTQLSVELSSASPLNHSACEATGTCVYAVNTATATVESDGLSFTLTNVDTSPDFPIEIRDERAAHTAYTETLLDAMHDSALLETDYGFSLISGAGPLEFFATDAAAGDAIRAYAFSLNESIRSLGGCEVRGIAPLFSRSDLTAREQVFRDALRGFSHATDLDQQRRSLRGSLGEDALLGNDEVTAFSLAIDLPFMMSRDPDTPDVVEQFWDGFGAILFRDDREAFDAAIAGYGDTIVPLVTVSRHFRESGFAVLGITPCFSLSSQFLPVDGG